MLDSKGVKSTSTQNIAWLAGIIEGEGCLRMETSNHKYRYPRIVVKMTDKDVVEQVHNIMGGSIREENRNGIPDHWKTQYTASISGKKAAGWLMTLYSFFGERRQQKVREILDWWKGTSYENQGYNRSKTHCPKGHEYTEENTRYSHPGKPWRSCRVCHREGMRT